MKRKFWTVASFSALVVAAMAPWAASQAQNVSVRVSTPEFGIRIGAPHFPHPVYQPAPVIYPAPVYYPRHYRYIPPPRYGWHRGHGYWHHRHWQHRHWENRFGHDSRQHGGHGRR